MWLNDERESKDILVGRVFNCKLRMILPPYFMKS